ncbi:MAG: serine hydroxymethyltransferase [Phycisphaerae bacterium]|nr:serine hydroxymethyltransferase [Phycisphaerae bacterium]
MDAVARWYESDAPSRIEQLRLREAERQRRNLILIPSESMCVPDASGLVDSEFGHIYAEGYPQPILDHVPRDSAVDTPRFGGWQRRLSDRRFYKGCVNVDQIELLAHRFVAEAFAELEDSPKAVDILVNAQALSGAAANNAVFEALLRPGDVIMGMKLSHGGHLTHGSEFNLSGRHYRAASYGVDPITRRIDYVDVLRLARQHRPKLIIGGTSAYPWDIEWNRLREVADDVGAFLLADIAHLAGMVVAGVLNNPLPYAEVVTFTTHKTLCGPRGALILSKSPEIAQAIDAAVFPGLQGGPHMNTVAGIARLFELINQRREAFARFQRTIVRNTSTLAQELTSRGFELEYGGTNTHMLLVDLRKLACPGEPDVPIDGEIASRLLELAGVVVNKNTLPGDEVAGESSGIRMGMPWATQRGITREQITRLAEIVHLVLSNVHTTRVWVPGNMQRCRGRIDPDIIRRARSMTDEIVGELLDPPSACPPPALNIETAKRTCLIVRGDKARTGLQQVMTCNLADLRPEDPPRLGLMLDGRGAIRDKACVFALPDEGREQRLALVVEAERAPRIIQWLDALSDGYALIDADDLQAKIDGPMVIEDASTTDLAVLLDEGAEWQLNLLPSITEDSVGVNRVDFSGAGPVIDVSKPYFIGQSALLRQTESDPKLAWLLEEQDAPNMPYTCERPELPIRKTALNDLHRELGARMVDFAGWDMPVQYPTGIFAEHRAVRTAAGLFDVSHMGVFEITGWHATAFLDTVLAGCVSRLDPGTAGYNYLLYPDGRAMDDVYLYRLGRQEYLLVVNAANAEEDWAWLQAVNSRRVVIDQARPGGPLKRVEGSVELRNLRDAGADSLVDLAIQGPRSFDVLASLTDRDDAAPLKRLELNEFARIGLAGGKAIVARTGYTGELVGYEIFVHPDRAVTVFRDVLDKGRELGVLPCGLGARDSTRTEAGFPLFGHELEGLQAGTLTEADYGFVPRFHVPFFIGRTAYMRRVTPRRRKMARLAGSGRKSLRPGHLILDDRHQVAGVVTSFAFINEDYDFIVLGYVDVDLDISPGRSIKGLRATSAPDTPVDDAKTVELTALTRFPTPVERARWAEEYRQSMDTKR